MLWTMKILVVLGKSLLDSLLTSTSEIVSLVTRLSFIWRLCIL